MHKLSTLPVLVGLVACAAYDPDLGTAPFTCDPAMPSCPEGYTCQSDGATVPKFACVSAGGLIPDAPGGGFQCSPDGSLEPNDTHDTAFVTDVSGAPNMTRMYGPLSICPEGDRDNFAVVVTTGQPAMEAIVSWDSGDPVTVAILNTGGAAIGPGMGMGANAVRACVANLPAGTYVASVSAGATTKNNYRVTLRLVANCAGG